MMLFDMRLLIVPVVMIIYGIFLFKVTGKERRTKNLAIAFSTIAFLSFIYHMFLFCHVTKSEFNEVADIWARIWFSMQYSVEMFFTNSIIFKGEVMDVLKTMPGMFYIYVPLYVMAIMTSAAAIFHIFSRKVFTYMWLRRHRTHALNGCTHIFFGYNPASKMLAETLDGDIIFVDLPEIDDAPQGITIWDIISRFFNNKDIDIINENHVILKAEKNQKYMDALISWLNCPNNNAYIISDDEPRNLRILEALWGFKCNIYCHAKKDGLVNRYDTFADDSDRIKFIDSSFLAVESMKKDPSGVFLPVKYVNIAKNENGKKLGYVTTPFNCAIIGFGETGQEALKFLYEFGSFPDQAKNKSPFKCHVFDNQNRETLFENYCDVNVTELDAATQELIRKEGPREVENHVCEVDSSEFWTEIQKLILDLNYIVISLGNDDLNLKIAMDVAELAIRNERNLKDRFIIAVRQQSTSAIRERAILNANKAFGNCIHIFGLPKSIWTKDNINLENLENAARMFYESYKRMNEPEVDVSGKWAARKKLLRDDDCEKRFSARRGIFQDYSNCLHITTKLELCSFTASKIADDIYDKINEKSEHSTPEHRSTFEYLAVCEHLRWNSAHIILGYKYTDGDKSDLLKQHPGMVAYSLLDDPTRHYDWLVVKNTLKQIKSTVEEDNMPDEIKIAPIEEIGYVPKPIDTSDVVLPEDLNELVEQMSENVHEVWAKSRIDQGWTLGAERNDEKKTHPCLVPYSELPEVEKDYDRDTALSTLKFIVKSGFEIKKVDKCKKFFKKNK